MAEFPALPLFTDAVVADCNHLSDDEFGLYMRILILMWRSPDCQIPVSPDWLEKRLRRPIAIISPLLTEFCVSDGNFFTQKRLYKEYLWVRKNRKKQSVNAKVLWNKKKGLSHSDAKPMPDDSQTDAKPMPPTPPHPTPPKTVNKKITNKTHTADLHESLNASGGVRVPDKSLLVEAMDIYNAMATEAGLSQCQVLTDKRKKSLKIRLAECGGLAGWKSALDKVAASSFLKGGGNHGFFANFDFVIQQKSFTKIMEGAYDDRKSTSPKKLTAHEALFAGFAQANVDDPFSQQ